MRKGRICKRESEKLAGACQLICDAIVEKLAKLLALPRDDISTAQAIASQGADSLIAVESRNWLIRDLDTNITIMDCQLMLREGQNL